MTSTYGGSGSGSFNNPNISISSTTLTAGSGGIAASMSLPHCTVCHAYVSDLPEHARWHTAYQKVQELLVKVMDGNTQELLRKQIALLAEAVDELNAE